MCVFCYTKLEMNIITYEMYNKNICFYFTISILFLLITLYLLLFTYFLFNFFFSFFSFIEKYGLRWEIFLYVDGDTSVI